MYACLKRELAICLWYKSWRYMDIYILDYGWREQTPLFMQIVPGTGHFWVSDQVMVGTYSWLRWHILYLLVEPTWLQAVVLRIQLLWARISILFWSLSMIVDVKTVAPFCLISSEMWLWYDSLGGAIWCELPEISMSKSRFLMRKPLKLNLKVVTMPDVI